MQPQSWSLRYTLGGVQTLTSHLHWPLPQSIPGTGRGEMSPLLPPASLSPGTGPAQSTHTAPNPSSG